MVSGSQERKDCELMNEFFDRRVDTYEDHMREVIPNFDEFYSAVVSPIPVTDSSLSILDLGCGTGVELDFVFERVPNARITAMDVSHDMLAKLKHKLEKSGRGTRVEIVQGSYLSIPFAECHFDYAISVQTMHHFTPDVKRQLYAKIARALKPGGAYIEGDYVAFPEEEQPLLERYGRIVESLRTAGEIGPDEPVDGRYHIDIPLSVETQVALLKDAGYVDVDITFRKGSAAVFRAGRHDGEASR